MIEIDEIISNTEYCADVYERMNKAIHPALQVSDYKRHAEDHRQLAEWLRDYKRLKEQEPCEDAISRQAVLDINESHHGQMPNHINHQIWQEIKDLPPVTPQPKWISCSERLPEEDGCYLVTTTGTNNDIIDIAYYTEGIWHKASRIKAWMPSPESYTAESEE